jgi:hypothetical protein
MLIGEQDILRLKIAVYYLILVVDCGYGLEDVACIVFEKRFSDDAVELRLIP